MAEESIPTLAGNRSGQVTALFPSLPNGIEFIGPGGAGGPGGEGGAGSARGESGETGTPGFRIDLCPATATFFETPEPYEMPPFGGGFQDTVVVSGDVQFLWFETSWLGNDTTMITTTLSMPSGRTIGAETTDSDVAWMSGPTFEVYTIRNPEPGKWTFLITAENVSDLGQRVSFRVRGLAAPLVIPPEEAQPEISMLRLGSIGLIITL